MTIAVTGATGQLANRSLMHIADRVLQRQHHRCVISTDTFAEKHPSAAASQLFFLFDANGIDSKTSEEIMMLLTDLNQQGVTVILVTHESDISEWARRKVQFRDGVIISDERREARRGGVPVKDTAA